MAEDTTGSKPKKNSQSDDNSKSITTWAQIVATSLIAIVGFVFTWSNSNQEDLNRKNSMATQLMSGRENSETNFRQSMFQPLITQILNDTLPIEKRVTIFAIFQNNFNDLFNSRAIFDVLGDTARQMILHGDSIKGNDIMDRLVQLARKTNEAQEQLIGVGGKQYEKDSIRKGDPFVTSFFKDDKKVDTDHTVTITIDSIKPDNIWAKIEIKTDEGLVQLGNGNSINISYFDSPLIDNVLLSDGDRIAITLEDLEPGNEPKYAKLKIIHFPADMFTAGYRPSIRRIHELMKGDD